MRYLTNLKSSSRKAIAYGVIGALFASGTAFAITDSAFTYSSAKTGYYGISNLGMAPASVPADNMFLNPGMSGGLEGSGCFHKGVNLPQGAVVTELVVYYAAIDEDDVVVTLKRQRLSDGNQQNIASKAMTDDLSGSRASDTVPITASRATIANGGFNYGFQVCLDSGGTFFGARITYTYTSAGD
jgi:hypothetical protein